MEVEIEVWRMTPYHVPWRLSHTKKVFGERDVLTNGPQEHLGSVQMGARERPHQRTTIFFYARSENWITTAPLLLGAVITGAVEKSAKMNGIVGRTKVC